MKKNVTKEVAKAAKKTGHNQASQVSDYKPLQSPETQSSSDGLENPEVQEATVEPKNLEAVASETNSANVETKSTADDSENTDTQSLPNDPENPETQSSATDPEKQVITEATVTVESQNNTEADVEPEPPIQTNPLLHSTGESQSTKELRSAMEPIDENFSMLQTFTVSRPLTKEEAKKLWTAFIRHPEYMLLPTSNGSIYKKELKESLQRLPDGKGGWVDVIVRSDEFTEGDGLKWRICRYGNEYKSKNYFLDIVIDPVMLVGTQGKAPDGNMFKKVMDGYIEEAGRVNISPILEDISSFTLRKIEYEIDFNVDKEKFSSEILTNLFNRSNMPAEYLEHETFALDSSKPEGHRGIISTSVKVDYTSWSVHDVTCRIERTMQKFYTVKDLADDDTPPKKLILRQMLSSDCFEKSIATYMMYAVMGGNYYTKQRAVEIIGAGPLDEEAKAMLVGTLELVKLRRGIHNAKMELKNDKETLFGFICNLHRLIELGINPVTIPMKFGIEELANPVILLYERYGSQVKEKEASAKTKGKGKPSKSKGREEPLLVEIDERVGLLTIPC